MIHHHYLLDENYSGGATYNASLCTRVILAVTFSTIIVGVLHKLTLIYKLVNGRTVL